MKKLVSTLLIVGFVLGAFQISSSVEAEQIEGNITSSPTPVFLDVKDNHWAKTSITNAVDKGYFKGYSDGTFKPNASVTRAEFAVLLARFSGKAEATDEISRFADLTNHWSEAEVNQAISLGFIDPIDYPNGFKPNTAVTRFEIAKWMTSGLSATDAEYKQALEDTKTTVIPVKEYFVPGIPETKSSYIAVALGTKLMNGYPDGSFGLDKPLSRAEAAIILLNLQTVWNQPADSFLGLKELREVGTERTNVETISPFTTRNTSFNDVVEKTYTFKNYAGSLKLHNYIVVDTEDFKSIDSIYASLFVDEKNDYNSRLDKPGSYIAFIQITIYPKTDGFNVDHYMSGARSGIVGGSRLLNNLPDKFGYMTMPWLETKEFFKNYKNGSGVTLWVMSYLTSNTVGAQLTTDDNSFVAIDNKE